MFLPPFDRPVGYVSQSYALFPHLDARDNVAFGLRASGLGRRAARHEAGALLERLGIGDLAARRPGQLSGGQQQRVALARALILEPALLLLDEPLSALDVETRHAVRSELRQLLAALSCVTVFVTHSPLEALVFGDRIVVLEHGRVAQVGDRAALLRQPRSRYVATLLGLNLLPGQGDGPASRRVGHPRDRPRPGHGDGRGARRRAVRGGESRAGDAVGRAA